MRISVIAAVLMALGLVILFVGIVRSLRRPQAPALRRAVATMVAGSGVAAIGLALLFVGTGTPDPMSLGAAGLVALVGFGQLMWALVIRRMPG